MLPVFSLDDESFQDIVERTKKLISVTYPEWTDYNKHDPGITFLELFAWMKEMQQYSMDWIGKEHQLKYLKLLGMEQIKRQPAKALIQVKDIKAGYGLPRGSRLLAGNICFETQRKYDLEASNIIKGIYTGRDGEESFDNDCTKGQGQIRFHMFGTKPAAADCFYIGFHKELTAESIHEIYFDLYEDYPVRRNPIEREDFYPLAQLEVEYYTTDGWRRVQLYEDTTCQLIKSGWMTFGLCKPMEALEERGGLYFVRIVVKRAEYDVPPLLLGISNKTFPVLQQKTLIEQEWFPFKKQEQKNGVSVLNLTSYLEIYGRLQLFLEIESGSYKQIEEIPERTMDLPKGRAAMEIPDNGLTGVLLVSREDSEDIPFAWQGNGFPNQKYSLNREDVLYDSLEIMAEDEGKSGIYHIWKKVDSFYASGPEDRHYVFHEETGELVFGNCEQGMAPEGRVQLIGLKLSLGLKGMVKKEQINKLVHPVYNTEVTNKDNAFGGREKETLYQCFYRFSRQQNKVERGVTYRDYEEIAKRTQGLMIKNVRAIPETELKKQDGSIKENCVSVVVEPFSLEGKRKLSDSYYKNIYRVLDKSRLIGSQIRILSPEYIGVSIYAEIIVKPQYQQAREIIRKQVEEYFEKEEFTFGSPVLYSTIYGFLDTLEPVACVNSLALEAYGRGCSQGKNGDLLLPPNGLAYLRSAEYIVSTM